MKCQIFQETFEENKKPTEVRQLDANFQTLFY